MILQTEDIEYQDGELKMRGLLAFDEAQTGKRPGMLDLARSGADVKGVVRFHRSLQTGARADWQVIAYNAQTDKKSWAAMRSFFDEIFA